MKVFKFQNDLTYYLSLIKDKKIGFVPTMGSLHKGHLILMETAKKDCDIVVCSIFVNPTQFNSRKDFKNYPRSLNDDIDKLITSRCDVLYCPESSDIYSKNEKESVFDFNRMTEFMEGKYRKGHFNGVATVVDKLFNIINPDYAYFGEKDLQQLQIIKYITKKKGYPINIIGVPTVRNHLGVAISSRNQLLSELDLKKSIILHQTLMFIYNNLGEDFVGRGVNILKTEACEFFHSQDDVKLEYLEIVSVRTMLPISHFLDKKQNAACLAATISGIRLIDNIIF